MSPHNFGLSVSQSYAAFVGTVMLRQGKSFRLNQPKTHTNKQVLG